MVGLLFYPENGGNIFLRARPCGWLIPRPRNSAGSVWDEESEKRPKPNKRDIEPLIIIIIIILIIKLSL
jgi:hypothetical protein